MIRKNQEEQNYLTYGQLNLITSSRFNWALLAAWTREYIHSVADGLGNEKEIGDRLYRVPVDFYNLVLPFVGKANADSANQSILESGYMAKPVLPEYQDEFGFSHKLYVGKL